MPKPSPNPRSKPPPKPRARASAPTDPLERLRALCLALPEAHEKEAWGAPTFRVRDKIFAMYDDHHHGAEHVAVWCNAPHGLQEVLVAADPERYFVPPYVGGRGWIGIRLDRRPPWRKVSDLLTEAWLATAPPRLRERLTER